jgi:HAD superfamily hydrolase (TIGR01509 family)
VGAPYQDRLPAEFQIFRQGVFVGEPINEGTVALARRLKRSCRLALCSNALRDLPQILARRTDIRDLFDTIVISVLVGLRKPNPAVLELTAERLGLPPAACLLVDDKVRNTEAAASIGMDGIVFESPEQLSAELGARGLLPAPA